MSLKISLVAFIKPTVLCRQRCGDDEAILSISDDRIFIEL